VKNAKKAKIFNRTGLVFIFKRLFLLDMQSYFIIPNLNSYEAFLPKRPP